MLLCWWCRSRRSPAPEDWWPGSKQAWYGPKTSYETSYTPHLTYGLWTDGVVSKTERSAPPLSHNGWIPWLGFLKSSLTWWKWFFTHKSFKFFSGLQWASEYLQLKSRFFPCEFQWQISEISKLQRYLVVIFALTLTSNWHFGSISLFLWPHIWRRGIFQKITY